LKNNKKKNEKFNNRKNNKRKREEDTDNNTNDKPSGKTHTPGVLLNIQNFKDIVLPEEKFQSTREFLKQALSEYGKISYIDSKEDICMIRFEEAQSAQNANKALVEEKKKNSR